MAKRRISKSKKQVLPPPVEVRVVYKGDLPYWYGSLVKLERDYTARNSNLLNQWEGFRGRTIEEKKRDAITQLQPIYKQCRAEGLQHVKATKEAWRRLKAKRGDSIKLSARRAYDLIPNPSPTKRGRKKVVKPTP